MGDFAGQQNFNHSRIRKLGVLVSNLGTPDEPTAPGLRRYLKEFLSDRRVIEMPRALWWLILNGIILNVRPKRSAALYQKIWRQDGSPLLNYTQAQTAGIRRKVQQKLGSRVTFAVGMRYGRPSIGAALAELEAAGAEQILVLPLYPQYCGATTGSTFDAAAAHYTRARWVPDLRFINHFHDDALYIEALKSSVLEQWEAKGRGQHLLISFHGIPKRYFLGGDPYYCHCQKTGRLLAEALGLAKVDYTVSFQSRFGRAEWLKPYTDETVKALPARGIKRLDVICPGFSADCLETIEEIDQQNREFFLHAGGEAFSYIPALNDREDFIRCLSELVISNLRGWADENDGWSEEGANAEARQRNDLAAASDASGVSR